MKKLYLIALLLVVFSLQNCKNPFATREPEPPDTGQSSWLFPTDPEIVLINMRSAFREKNVENYMKCLVDSNALFRFVPDEYEASNSSGIFEQWSLAFEQNYINKLFTSIPYDSTRNLSFSLNSQRVDYADSVLIRTDYDLQLHHVYPRRFPSGAQGKVDFWFFRRNGYWVIYRWADHKTIVDSTLTRLPSWSTIKANFVN